MTDPRPRHPPTIWTTLRINWCPTLLPPPEVLPYEETFSIKLTPRGPSQWHAYETPHAVFLTHNINLEMAVATTNIYVEPPTDQYEPLRLLYPFLSSITSWRPYTIPESQISTPFGSSGGYITFTQTNPGLILPAPILAAPHATGRWDGLIIENRQTGTTARTVAPRRKTDSAAQLYRQGRYATACEFWRSLTTNEKRAWTAARHERAPDLNGFNLYLSLALLLRTDRALTYAQLLNLTLRLPPEPGS